MPVAIFAQTTKPMLVVEPAPATQPFVPRLIAQKIEGGYAVVVSKSTLADAEWAKVVDALKEKYGEQVKVFVWDGSVESSKGGLVGNDAAVYLLRRYTQGSGAAVCEYDPSPDARAE